MERILILMIMSSLFSVIAAESEETLPVIGRKPQLAAITLPEGSIAGGGATVKVSDYIKVGQSVSLDDMGINLHALITDSDGDREGGSIIEWSVDNGAWSKSETFMPNTIDGGQTLKVRVIPKTLSGIPDTGEPVISNSVIIRASSIERFTLHPTKATLTFIEARNYCSTLGQRLPTRVELRTAFLEGTSFSSVDDNVKNTEMCSRYGWSLSGACGGSLNAYWTDTDLEYVRMNSGSDGKHLYEGMNIANVACIK